MDDISQLIANNREWSRRITEKDPGFFTKLASQQAPHYLWIGCSDSRVPANEITGLMPGELFVHRNVANIFHATDLNALSVVEFAVNVLKVSHIIVCGHYGCGGVRAAMEPQPHGLIDNWLNKIRDTHAHHRAEIHALPTEEERVDRLCELNVIDQVKSVTQTTIVQEAWLRGQNLTVHGWIYGLKDGHVKDLGVRIDHVDQVSTAFRISA